MKVQIERKCVKSDSKGKQETNIVASIVFVVCSKGKQIKSHVFAFFLNYFGGRFGPLRPANCGKMKKLGEIEHLSDPVRPAWSGSQFTPWPISCKLGLQKAEAFFSARSSIHPFLTTCRASPPRCEIELLHKTFFQAIRELRNAHRGDRGRSPRDRYGRRG